MNNTSSDRPPTNPKPGDLWFNTKDNNFYVHDYANRWIAVDDENNVVDIIMHGEHDPIKAYDRAMGVI